MSRASRQRRGAKRARERQRRRAKTARRERRSGVELPALLVSTFAHADEMEVAGGPLEADDHPDCGRYGLQVRVVVGGLVMQTDGVLPGCLPIREAEEEALRALHAEAAAEGALPGRITYQCVRPVHKITQRGVRLLDEADPTSTLAERESELHEREVVPVELGGRGLRGAWRRWRSPLRRAA